MASVHHTSVSLRLSGSDLDPDAITHALGVAPSKCVRKGDIISIRYPERTSKAGLWELRTPDRMPGDIDAQINELVRQLPSDPALWRPLSAYGPHMWIGVFLNNINEGFGITRTTLEALSARGIELEFDIYGPGDDET